MSLRATGLSRTPVWVARPTFNRRSERRWRGAGSLSIEKVTINGSGETPTQGSFSAMSLTSAEVAAVESFGHTIPTLP